MRLDTRNASYLFSKWELTVQILNCISNNRDRTIPKIMQKTGASYTAIKNIIDELASQGIIAEQKFSESKDRGRPPKTYQILKSFDINYPPRKYDLLLSYIISNLKSNSKLDLEQLLSEIGIQMAVEKIYELKKHNIKVNSVSELASIIDADLNGENIPHDIKTYDNYIEIKIYSCVFKNIATEFSPLICVVHEKYYSKLLEDTLATQTSVIHKSNLSKHEPDCTFILTMSKTVIK
ncbi:MAG: hypothetical protein QW327_00860 [Candidatus Odinarchaeota archaeon]